VSGRPRSGKAPASRRPLPISLARQYLFEAALGMQHYHEQGIIHRDIKPSNLMVVVCGGQANTERLKVLDMGLARLAAESNITRTGFMGSADYVSPEQVKNARDVTITADIYSLGCTFYHLMTASRLVRNGIFTPRFNGKLRGNQSRSLLCGRRFRNGLPDCSTR